MLQFRKKMSEKKGLPPGTLLFVGAEKDFEPEIKVFDYDAENLEEKVVEKIEECVLYRERNTVTWANVDGIHDLELIENIGRICNLHPLLLEDIVNTTHRPKMDDFEEHLFIVLKMIRFDKTQDKVTTEQISLVLGPNFVISFQESRGDVFDYVRERIRKNKGRIRKMGADYLAYSLIDAIVDEYYTVLERMGDQMEELEDELMENPREETARKIYMMKKELIFLLRAIWPLREVVSGLEKGESELVTDKARIFFSDVFDHVLQVMETIETYRDVLSGMLEAYLTSVSNRMNSVMKVLTVIATVFIPLTFIAGVYGMNFEHMPELHWRYGYPFILSLMFSVVALMIVYFRKNSWL